MTSSKSDTARRPRQPKPLPPAGDIVWGAAAIGAVIGLTERQTFHKLRELPVQKIGGRYCASRARLLEFCSGGRVEAEP